MGKVATNASDDKLFSIMYVLYDLYYVYIIYMHTCTRICMNIYIYIYFMECVDYVCMDMLRNPSFYRLSHTVQWFEKNLCGPRHHNA